MNALLASLAVGVIFGMVCVDHASAETLDSALSSPEESFTFQEPLKVARLSSTESWPTSNVARNADCYPVRLTYA